MNELQRQAYMDAMGVDCYTPRLQLPGSLPSSLCDMTDVAIAEWAEQPAATSVVNNVQNPPMAAPQPMGSSRAAAMQVLFDETPKTAGNKVTDVTAGLVGATKVVREKAPQFSLSITRANNVLLIDEGLPGDINPAEYLQLLQNIVFAVGAGHQQLSIDAFVWPMIRNSQIDQSEVAARQTLEAFIAKQIEQLSTRYILVMGATPAHYLSQTTLPGGELPVGEFVQHPQLAAQLLRTRSAYPLLREPALKREVWNDLQPLYRVLKKN